MPVHDKTEHPVVLFDGVCNLCNRLVHFLIDRDPKGHLRFAALQSGAGRRLLAQCHRDATSPASLLFVEAGKCYAESSAALRITRYLCGCYPLLGILYLVPPFLRNAVYAYMADNRYRWFGKRDTCPPPSAEHKARFLE